MQKRLGHTIDRYHIIKRIGEDQWGELFDAYDPDNDQKVVLHAIQRDLKRLRTSAEQILRNGREILGWRQPGIAKVLDVGEKRSFIYLVKENLAGVTLRRLMDDLHENGKWISLGESVQIVLQLLEALDFSHQHGIIHGNLEPDYLMLLPREEGEQDFQAVLLNLGFVNPETPSKNTSPTYNPPEQSRGEEIDRRADIYACGALLFELTTSQPRSTEGGPFSTLPPRILRPDLPVSIENVILKAMETDPENRYQEAGEMSQALFETKTEASQVATPPPKLKEIAGLSLTTRHLSQVLEEPVSKDEEPSLEVRPAPEEPPEDTQIERDYIHILMPDQSTRSVPVLADIINIGRGSDNHLVIEHSTVSRRHARIEFDGTNYVIRDLNSLNGTFLGDARLKPDEIHIWVPGENLRLGEIWLRLERAGQDSSTIAMLPDETKLMESSPLPPMGEVLRRSNGTPIDSTQIKFSPSNRIGVHIDSPNISVTPGKPSSTTILLFNRGKDTDLLKLTFVGAPLEWLPNRPQSVNVPPSGQREVNITFKPPRASESRAGRHRITLRITSEKEPDQTIEVRISLNIAAFSNFSSGMEPGSLTQGKKGKIIVHNQGNLPETITVLWDDKLRELIFDPPQAKINIQPGETATVEFRASLAKPRWIGRDQSHSYGSVVSLQSGQHQAHAGEFISRSLIPPWVPVAIISMCLILACLGVIFFNSITSPSNRARETDSALQTANSQSTQEIAQANTATAGALANANLATIQAVTATASWQQGDDDADGLTNGQELLYNTLPDKMDTDEDGLSDGDEINTWKTDPLVSDTDGDGLKDGLEIERKIDPLKKDTDGDGLEDAIDPEPGKAMTHTATRPLVTDTPNPSATTTQSTSADLSVTINNGTSTLTPGTNVAYTILVKNNGPNTVYDVRVNDTLPPELINVSWTCTSSAGSVCRAQSGSGSIDARNDLIVNGTATYLVNGTLVPAATGVLINSVTVSAPPGVIETNTGNNSASDSDTLTPRVSFTFSITDNRTSIHPGENTTYTIVVTNNGPSKATGVTITDYFPGSLTSITWTCSATSGGSCSPTGTQGGNVNVSLSLDPGATASIVANTTLIPTAAGTLSNTASLTSPIDPLANNRSVTDTTTIVPQADLTIEIDAPVAVFASTTVTYTLTITNEGISNATGVVLVMELPDEATFTSSSPGSPVCQHSSGTVTCNLGNLTSGNDIEIEIVIDTPAVSGPISAEANVTANESDPDPGNNTETVLIQVI